jgi:hypothetical protein
MLQWLDTLIGLVVIILSVSLIIMILNQIIVALLNLRGRNLKNSIVLLLENSSDELKDYADKISQKALSHPLVSDKRSKSGYMSLATTIRPKELLGILDLLSGTGEEEWQKKLKQYLPKITESVENWFENIMDRAAQSFVGQTRIWTIVFSIIIAFALHLDAFRLFEQISSDAELRASLVASSSAILNQAESVVGGSGDVPAVYSRSIVQLKEVYPAAAELPPPPAFASREEGENWIREQIGNSNQADSLVIHYRSLIETSLKSSIERLQDKAFSIKNDIEKSRLQLIPDPYPGFNYTLGSKHFWGVLVMAGLLSLGAPFWYKALKSMTALRPILAEKADKEKRNQ